MNKLVVIGFRGNKKCYLNIPVDQAIKRWIEENGTSEVPNIETFTFGDEFEAYDVWR